MTEVVLERARRALDAVPDAPQPPQPRREYPGVKGPRQALFYASAGQQGQPSPLLSEWSRELAARLPISPAAKFTPQIPAFSPAEARARDVAAAIETLDRLADPTVPMDEVSPDKLQATRGKLTVGSALDPSQTRAKLISIGRRGQVGARSGGC